MTKKTIGKPYSVTRRDGSVVFACQVMLSKPANDEAQKRADNFPGRRSKQSVLAEILERELKAA